MSVAAHRPEADDVPSPCASICVLDASHALCLGCGRTLHEIATWAEMSADQKRAVVASLPARRMLGRGKPP